MIKPIFINTYKMSNLIWIDGNIESNENKEYLKELDNLNEFIIYSFKEVNKGIEKLKQIKFRNTYIICSGAMYKEFITNFEREENNINVIPKILIFTRDKNKFIERTKDIKEKLLDKSFYSFGGIRTEFSEVKEFLLKKNPGKRKIEEEKLIFEYVDDIKKLYLPIYYKTLIKITPLDDFDKFNKFILSEYSSSEDILELFSQINYLNNIPKTLLSKYYTRAYTIESNLYKEMNSELSKGNKEKFLPFIKMLYEGNKLGSLPIYSENKNLYRGGKISNEEIKKIKEYLNKKIEGLPGAIVYSRSFLSFSKDERKAKEFIKKANNNYNPVFFIIQNSNNDNKNLLTHSDIENISFYKEKEVLFFPFSSFEINKIEDTQINGIKTFIIYLNYLGKYETQLKNVKDINQIIPNSSFKNDIIESKIIENANYNPKIIFEHKKNIFKKLKILRKSILTIIWKISVMKLFVNILMLKIKRMYKY